MSDDGSVYFRPTFGDPQEVQSFFASKGFTNIRKLTLYDNFGFVLFDDGRTADDFIRVFDGIRVNGCTLSVQHQHKSKPARESSRDFRPPISRDPPRSYNRPRVHSKTISVRGIPENLLTERKLFNEFYSTGFIRQVEVKDGVGYILFDTENDAARAIDTMDRHKVDMFTVYLDSVEDRPMNLPRLGIPLIVQEQKTYERK